MAGKKGGKSKKRGNRVQQIADGLRNNGVSKKAAHAIAGVVATLGRGQGKGKKQGKKGK